MNDDENDEIVLHPDTLNELDSSELALLAYLAKFDDFDDVDLD